MERDLFLDFLFFLFSFFFSPSIVSKNKEKQNDYIKQSFEDGARSLRIDTLYVRCKGSHGYVCLLLNGIRDESCILGNFFTDKRSIEVIFPTTESPWFFS